MARETEETWGKRIERWAESGLTAKEFAAEIGVNAGTLMQWKYRLAAKARRPIAVAERPKAEAVFVEVKPGAQAEPASPDPQSPFELILTNGAVLRIPAQFDVATLRRLLDVMVTR
jgi:hypothetical protein